MRKALVLLAVLITTSCTYEERAIGITEIVLEAATAKRRQPKFLSEHAFLYFGEPRPEEFTTSESTEICLVYLRGKPERFTVDAVVKNKANGFETVVHLVNFDATVAEAKACAEESVPLEWGVNRIVVQAPPDRKAFIVVTRETGE